MDEKLCQEKGFEYESITQGCILEGFHRYKLRGENYPVCRRKQGARVVGAVVTVRPDQIVGLDDWEDINEGMYVRREMDVWVPRIQDVQRCFVYLQGPEIKNSDLYSEWSFVTYSKNKGLT